jgi:hypothetical protein
MTDNAPVGADRPVREVLNETWVLSRQGGTWRVQAFWNCPEQAG